MCRGFCKETQKAPPNYSAVVPSVMFKTMKYTLIAVIFIFSSFVYAEPDKLSLEAIKEKHCSRPAVEVEINQDLFEISWSTDILVKLLSGNIDKAIGQLGSELRNKIYVLQEHLNENPCNANEALRNRIYPVFRVVAAANAKTPILKFNDDPEVLKFLQQAIDANPEHYKNLTERSKEWQNGIK